MKNKALKQFIKDKANDVTIKDFSLEIIEKAKMQVNEPSVIEKQSFRLRLKPIFALSLALVTTFVLAFLWTPSLSDDPFVIEAYDQAMMVSSVSMIYAYDIEVNQQVSLLQSISLDSTYLIEDQLEGLNTYFPLIEQFFESNANFDKEVLSVEGTNYLYHLKFSSKTSSNVFIDYELKLLDTVIKLGENIIIEGYISFSDDTYPIIIEFNQNQPEHFLMTSLLEDEQTIEILYEKSNNEASYRLQLLDRDTVIKSLMLKKDALNQVIDLNFEKGTMNGTYRFRQTEDKVLGVSYAIVKENISETGRINISITPRENMPTLYEIDVRPQGGTPFNREEEREPTPPRPTPRPTPPRGPFSD
ncbi:MAG: hypothetical protein ACNA7K_02385 [Acholeplasmataceae bacterium]